MRFKGLFPNLTICSAARFDLRRSTVPGLLDGTNCRLIRKRSEALVYYLQSCYFPVLKRAKHHVLYTIPLDSTDGHHHRHTLTSLKFQITPFCHASGLFVEGLYGKHRALFERNMIVLMGMIDHHPMPCCELPRGFNWVGGVTSEIPTGTVCISRKTFLEARVLSVLEKINRETTVVPEFFDVNNGEWDLHLTTWDKHAMKSKRSCEMTPIHRGDQTLDFKWENKDEWNYRHEGDNDCETAACYTVRCEYLSWAVDLIC